MEQEKKCADLVQQKFNETEADFKAASEFFEEYENATEGEQIALIVVDKHKGNYYHEYEDLFDYVNQTALSWDHVEADGKEAGYYRLQFSLNFCCTISAHFFSCSIVKFSCFRLLFNRFNYISSPTLYKH